MSLLNSILLITGIGAALPIIIHLLTKERPKPLEIPTVAFIKKALEKSASRSKINHLFLLICRIFALLLLTLIISRPVFNNKNTTVMFGPQAAVIILDDSYFSGQKIQKESMLMTAKKWAIELTKKFPPGSKIALLTPGKSDLSFTGNNDYLKAQISQLTPVPFSGNVRNLIYSAVSILKNSEHSKKRPMHIYIASDLNKGSWGDDFSKIETKNINIHIKKLAPRSLAPFIESVLYTKVDNEIYINRNIKFQCVINGGKKIQGAKIQFKINNVVLLEQYIDNVSETGKATIIFNHTFSKAEMTLGEISLVLSDSLPEDNNWYFVLNPKSSRKLLCVGNLTSGEIQQSDLFVAALTPQSWNGRQLFEIERESYGRRLNGLKYADFDAVILTGKINLNQKQWIQISQYVKAGGKLLINPDKSVNPAEVNANALPLLKGKLVLKEPRNVVSPMRAKNSKLSRKIMKQAAKSFSQIKIKKYFTLEFTGGKIPDLTKPVINFSNGDPAFLTHYYGKGKISFLGLSHSLDFSDFLLNDSFAITLHDIIKDLLNSSGTPYNYFCTDTVEIPIDSGVRGGTLKILSPDSNVNLIENSDFTGDLEMKIANYSFTEQQGIYKTNSNKLKYFSCNILRNSYAFSYPEISRTEALLNSTLLNEDSKNYVSRFFSWFLSPSVITTCLLGLLAAFMVVELFIGNKGFFQNADI